MYLCGMHICALFSLFVLVRYVAICILQYLVLRLRRAVGRLREKRLTGVILPQSAHISFVGDMMLG